ncbi:ABC transporter substrate-binding protein [Aminobacter aminovorans]|jgi:branched-chain amino acid transport system substrate-binding protein|uniref:Branched-chain amino acid transport system substrate-binding protein n=1 Tax=Aminobacter aminovorans TaxID=83263 RepID=A0AAC8YVD6_AMIAI|nr:ABC transporter substrate-binding protein [Aminobacter aminovorans]AMS45177.1 Receptor family ligand binding region family protein 28 [Aminobacter aminovorans]MBB3705065.1 branched-chain amino acid transport system substrate-binding protein [Aminobacter aminovorans]
MDILVNRRRVLGMAGAALATALMPRLANAQQGQDINVGVVLPLSGPSAQFGINSKNGLELAVEELNAAGGIKALGGAQIRLIVADSTSAPTAAATAAQRLIAQNEVVAVIGAYVSSLTLAVSEVMERRGIPFLTISYADQLTERGFKTVFRLNPKASALGQAQVNGSIEIAAASGAKLERAAILYEDTAYGTAQSAGLRKASQAAGLSLVMDEAYPQGITDVTPLINKLRASEAQVVFAVSYLNDTLQIVRTMRQQKILIPVVGGAGGFILPEFAKALGELSEGVLSVNSSNYDLDEARAKRYRDRFNYPMVHDAIEHAALIEVLGQSLEIAAATTSEALRSTVAAKRFEGGWLDGMPGAAADFDDTGHNVLAEPIMIQWRSGEMATVWPTERQKMKPVWVS